VYVTFDPKLVGAPPSKPLEPKKPQGLVLDVPKAQPAPSNKPAPTAGNAGTKAESNTPPAGAGKTNEKHSSAARLDDSQMLAMAFPDPQAAPPKSDAKASETKGPKAPSAPPAGSGKPAPAAKSAPNTKPAAPAAPKLDPKAEYDKALAQYKKDLEKYENDKSEFEKKLKKGQDKVKQLNERFGPWYYVISAESFENLRQGRASLVQPKGKAAEKKPGAGLDLHPPLGEMPGR